MKRTLLALFMLAFVAGCSAPFPVDTGPSPADSLADIAVEEAVLDFVSDLDTTAVADEPVEVFVVSGDSPVVATKSADPVVSAVADSALSISFVASPVNGDLFKLSIVISNVEDVGIFTAFQWDSVIPDALNFEGVLAGTDGVTNGWAGIMANATKGHAKYGRTGGYTSSAAPGKVSGVLVDMYFRGPIGLADQVTLYNFKISFYAIALPVHDNPRIE